MTDAIAFLAIAPSRGPPLTSATSPLTVSDRPAISLASFARVTQTAALSSESPPGIREQCSAANVCSETLCPVKPSVEQAGTAIVWLSSTALRLFDNPALYAACTSSASHVVPVVFVQQDGTSPWISGNDEQHAAHCFQLRLRERGGDAIILRSSPRGDAGTILDMCGKLRAPTLYMHSGWTERARQDQAAVLRALERSSGIECVVLWDGTLFDPMQLNPRIGSLPASVDEFAEGMQDVVVAKPLPAPDHIPAFPPGFEPSELGGLHFKTASTASVPKTSLCGEMEARACMRTFASGGSLVSYGGAEASRQSIPLRFESALRRLVDHVAVGSLSARALHSEITCSLHLMSPRRFCASLELVSRDFLIYQGLKRGVAQNLSACEPGPTLT
jgi:deoxyribodipyrimidine photolyase